MIDPADFEPGPPAEVRMERRGDAWVLIFVQELDHPPGLVWRALTEPGELDQWAPFTSDRDLGSPGAATITMIDGEVREEMRIEVLRAVAPSLLEYSWGGDQLRWELAPIEGGTRLTLHHQLGSDEMRFMVAAGWHICLVVMARLLDGEPIGPIRGSDALAYGWDELREAYTEKLAE